MKESGTRIKNILCECGSRSGRQVYLQEDGTIDSYCFACKKYFNESGETIEGRRMEQPERITRNINAIPELPVLAIEDRKIRQSTAKVYDVHVEVSPEDAETITAHYYPDRRNGEVVGYEVKQVRDKRFSALGDRKGDLDLWGSHLPKKGKKLFITEGRLDAMSLYQAIVDNTPSKYSEYTPSVVSLTRGASGAVKDIIASRDYVESFDEVVLCFDMDDAGRQAVKDVLKVFPLFKVAKYPLKDASDMLMADRGKELYQACVWDSSVERQGQVVDVHDFIDKAMEKPQMGISFPWDTVTKACFGIRPNTIHVVGAAPKIGKTDHEHQLVHHLVYKEKVKVGVFDLENSPVKTAKKLASKEAKIDFTRPDREYSDDLLRSTLMSLDGMVRFYDRGGSREWDDIRIAMEEMHLLDGINIFILDPLTALVSRYSASEANDKLNEIATDMADFVSKYPVTLFCYSHVNPKPKTSKPHEAGARVYSSEFTGSRAMEKWFHYGHGISRDRTEECPPERKNVSEFYMLFDRDFGQTYLCDVYFDEDTVTYLEM
jgi:twinkle protein